MKQIIPGLWQIDEIGSFVNCYAWEWEEGVTLIDAGMRNSAPDLLTALATHGWPLHTVRRILVTHADADHVGGLATVKRASGARVACHTVEKAYLEQTRRRKPAWYLRPAIPIFGLFPAFRVEPVTPDELLIDGQVTPEGFTVIHTPGHTPGHISLLHKERRLLVTGDALNNRKGRLSPPPAAFTSPDPSAAAPSASITLGNTIIMMLFMHVKPQQCARFWAIPCTSGVTRDNQSAMLTLVCLYLLLLNSVC